MTDVAMAEKVLSAVDYFIGTMPDDDIAVVFINHQLTQWEGVSLRLERWLAEGAPGINPYSPPITSRQAEIVIARLRERVWAFNDPDLGTREDARAATNALLAKVGF
jgi:hypothetical protein